MSGQKIADSFGPNREALEESLRALAVQPQHRVLVQACRSLASLVDEAAEFDDKAWREYRLALGLLMGEANVDLDDLEREIAELGGAQVVNP